MSQRDLIDSFVEWTGNEQSPEIYRKWSAISLIGAAAERRIFSCALEDKPVYPNLFIMLVGRPGRGKGIINTARALSRYIKRKNCSADNARKPLFICPDDITGPAIIDKLADSVWMENLGEGKIEQYSFLTVFAEEMNVFLKGYETSFLSSLSFFWNCFENFQQNRRTGNIQINIVNPGLNLLIGAQPAMMATILPEVAWGQGFMGRTIMVYSEQEIKPKLFTKTAQEIKDQRGRLKLNILQSLSMISGLRGEMHWNAEAAHCLINWVEARNCAPTPRHPKLEDYLPRRIQNVTKLSICMALSRFHEQLPEVQAEDVERALQWLFEAEELMPDVFRAMVGRSDKDIIEEAYLFAMKVHVSQKRDVPKSLMMAFLKDRCPHDKINSILNLLVEMDYLDEIVDEGTFRPRARNFVDLEVL